MDSQTTVANAAHTRKRSMSFRAQRIRPQSWHKISARSFAPSRLIIITQVPTSTVATIKKAKLKQDALYIWVRRPNNITTLQNLVLPNMR